MSDVPAIQSITPPTISVGGGAVDTSRLSNRANLDKAGKQFEAVFTSMMVKAMRATHLAEDDLFGSKGMDTFKDMQDQQFAKNMAEHTPLGIGKAMTDFLGKGLARFESIAAPDNAAPGDASSTP